MGNFIGRSTHQNLDRKYEKTLEYVLKEKDFWTRWYERTRDYSVGPAATTYLDKHIMDRIQNMTRHVLAKYRGVLKDGTTVYFLPRGM